MAAAKAGSGSGDEGKPLYVGSPKTGIWINVSATIGILATAVYLLGMMRGFEREATAFQEKISVTIGEVRADMRESAADLRHLRESMRGVQEQLGGVVKEIHTAGNGLESLRSRVEAIAAVQTRLQAQIDSIESRVRVMEQRK